MGEKIENQACINSEIKYETHINGLDDLLFGGLQLRPIKKECRKDSCVNEGTIIIIQGPRGVFKTTLALQMLYGLTKSLRKENNCICSRKSLFFSVNKTKEQLSDMLLDTVISKMIYKFISNSLNEGKEDHSVKKLCRFLFETEEQGNALDDYESLTGDSDTKNINEYILRDIIYYNNRTNSLHIRDPKNLEKGTLLFHRKYNSISEYINDSEENYKEYIFDVSINKHKEEDKKIDKSNTSNSSYSYNPLQEFEDIASTIEDLDEPGICIAIDGFSQLSSTELSAINFTHLEKILRKKSTISILVFDEAEHFPKCNADLVIAMHREEDHDLKYMFHQLRIAKSVFQTVACGWHQYKVRDYGIEVYKSTHLLIQKRRYIPKIIRNAHNSIISNTYEKMDQIALKEKKWNEFIKDDINNSLWKRFKANKSEIKSTEGKLLKSVFIEQNSNSRITAIVGPKNSYKRFLSIGYLLSLCSCDEHTLMISLDKDEGIVLNQSFCPAMKDVSNKCKRCYSHLHVFSVRMGCIDSDEFFHYLKEQINLIFYDKKTNSEKKIKRIVLGDMIKVDYSFPFLKNDPLFLPAFISFCRQSNIDALIFSSEKSIFAPALDVLADNVIHTERDYSDDTSVGNTENTLLLHVDKYCGPDMASNFYTFKISDVNDMFSCTNSRGDIKMSVSAELVAKNKPYTPNKKNS